MQKKIFQSKKNYIKQQKNIIINLKKHISLKSCSPVQQRRLDTSFNQQI